MEDFNSKYTGKEVENILDSVGDLEGKLFVGTKSEYDVANAEGKVKVGALVIILDGSEDANDTIALLGTATLGRMILGNS